VSGITDDTLGVDFLAINGNYLEITNNLYAHSATVTITATCTNTNTATGTYDIIVQNTEPRHPYLSS